VSPARRGQAPRKLWDPRGAVRRRANCEPRAARSGAAHAVSPARRAYALRTAAAACNPSRSIVSSRILNFCTLPVTVIGNSSAKTT
jgi:hypothetical protein